MNYGISASNWQPLENCDIDSLVTIAEQIHIDLPERPEVFAEKIKLFPAGCRGLIFNDKLLGYGISHLWNLNDIPPLDDFLKKLPENPDCMYIHDVAILPEMRGRKATDGYMDHIKKLAREMNVDSLALVSLYGTGRFWNRFGFKTYCDKKLNSKLEPYGETAKYMICNEY